MAGPIELKSQKSLLTRANGASPGDKTHNVLERAQEVAIRLESDRVSARDHARTSLEQSAANVVGLLTSPDAQMGNPVFSSPKLPAIPIPTFSGQIWEYQNFWTLFAENVHNQPLSKLQKFNYLMKALRGEARESVRRFPISEENYDNAVEFLRTKYGNNAKFTACLQSRLEKVKAESTLIQEQRRLLESIIPIVTQLEKEGVHLNGSFMIQKVLSKFSTNLQRKVWAARMDSGSEEINWTMKDIISDLDKIITTEERINEMMGKNTNFGTRIQDHDRRALSPSNVQEGSHWTSNPHLVKFPAEVTLHDHSIILKWHSDGQLQMIETICRGIDFCSNIECNLCLPILWNPECWPLGAIIMAALILYGIAALVYILLYVPMTIGKPIRLVLSGIRIILKYAMRLAFRSLLRIVRRRRPSTMSRRARIAAALAIVWLMTTSAKAINGCQHVNILEHQLTTCTEAQGKESWKHYYIVNVLPNVPVNLPSLQITMTMVTIPPMPALNTEFITDGTDTSIWKEILQIMQSNRGELKRLQQAYNALKQEATDYKNALKEEKQKLRKLRRAIPPLPEPEKLYESIVGRCREFYECTKRLTDLNTRIRSLQTSSADWAARFHELELIEATVDRMRIEFLFVRSQIRTLFSVPPLLIAKNTVSENIWNAMMEREQ
ncbi:hypothetical protein GCK32_012485, partial [Trichostrongylus colubriformis]